MSVPAIPLADGVYRIPTLGDVINSFAFLESDGSVTLVDCGLSRAPARIVRALASIGRHPSDVQRIVLTHAHGDHAGGAAAMVAQSATDGIEVHADDAAFVREGRTPPTDPGAGAGWLFRRFGSTSFTAAPVRRELHDDDRLDVAGGLRVVHTPGHTPGHVSLLHEPTGVLITGDSIFNIASRRTWPVAAFCTSAEQSRRTAARLADLEFGIAAFTHGPHIAHHARETIRGFLKAKGRVD